MNLNDLRNGNGGRRHNQEQEERSVDLISLDEENTFRRSYFRSKPKPAETRKTENEAGYWDLISFGICLTASNLVWAWPILMHKGFWSAFFGNIVTTALFISLNCCMAEMISILPFSGGTYGFARVTVGPYFGFLVGCFESIGNLAYTAIGLIPLGCLFGRMSGFDERYEPVYWVIVYGIFIINEFCGRKHYFRILNILAFITVMTYLLYIIISIPNIHPKKYLPADAINETFKGGIIDFFHVIPFSSFFFFGMEIMPLVSDEVKDARRLCPAAIITTTIIVTIFSFLFIFLYYCQYPSYPYDNFEYGQTHLLALNSGFSNGFGISDRMATMFSYLLIFSSVSTYFYGCCKQLRALSNSKLFPSFLGLTFKDTKIPYNAVIVAALGGFCILLVGLIYDSINIFAPMMVNLYAACLMGTYTTYIIIFISFIIFRKKYSTLQRIYRNPFGNIGAYFGIFLTAILLITVIGFSNDDFDGLKIFICFVSIMSLYYYFYARHRQTFSEDEQKILFVVYLLKANEGKDRRGRGLPFATIIITWISSLFQIRRLFPFFPFIFQSTTNHHRHNSRPKVHPVLHHSRTPSIPSSYKDTNCETEPTELSRNSKANGKKIQRHLSTDSWEEIQYLPKEAEEDEDIDLTYSPSPIQRENHVNNSTTPNEPRVDGNENDHPPQEELTEKNKSDINAIHPPNYNYQPLVIEEHSSFRC